MVSIKLKFRPSTIEGKAGSLYYQVIYMRKVRQVATNFRITQSEWDSELEDLIIKDDDSSRANYLQYIQNHIEYDKKCFNRIGAFTNIVFKGLNIKYWLLIWTRDFFWRSYRLHRR